MVSIVDILDKIYKRIGIPQHNTTDIVKICEDLPEVYEVYSSGQVFEVNQMGSPRTIKYLEKFQPRNIYDLSVVVAAIRPGAMSLVDKVMDRDNYKIGVPEIDDMLFEHTGIGSYVLYQESIMAMLAYADIPMKETYTLVKAISKKKLGVIQAAKEDFIKGMVKKLMKEEDETSTE